MKNLSMLTDCNINVKNKSFLMLVLNKFWPKEQKMQYILITLLFSLGILIFAIGFVSIDKTTRYFFLIFGVLTMLFSLMFLDFGPQQKRSLLPSRIIFHLSGDSTQTNRLFYLKKHPLFQKTKQRVKFLLCFCCFYKIATRTFFSSCLLNTIFVSSPE